MSDPFSTTVLAVVGAARVEGEVRMDQSVALPDQLAPALRERVEALLAEVTVLTSVPEIDPAYRKEPKFNRCVVCHKSGVLGGHHGQDGRIEWIHRSCHRRLHRARGMRAAV